MKRALFCLLMALLCMAAASALADTQVDAVVPASSGYAVIHATPNSALDKPMEQDGLWLFLPAFADRQQITLTVNGEETPVDWASAQSVEDGVERLSLNGLTLYVMQSQNLRALFLESDDPVNQGRAYIEGSDEHQTSTTASMALVDTNGGVNHAGRIKKLRGRGNGTWGLTKKPYQFKLEDKADLLDTGDPSEHNRTWVLLADALDVTLLHNRIFLDLGLEMGITETSRSEHVDLFYDGEYRGLYLLCEKVEIGEGRIEEMDSNKVMEELQQNQNPDELPDGEGQNAYGLECHWVEGANGPEDPSALTYLVEVESSVTLSERAYFVLGDGTVMGIKSPENANEEMVRYISEKMESARRTLIAGGVNPDNGHTIQQDFDVEAFARLAIINEWAFNLDSFNYSSTWFILPAGEDQFRPGPPWDSDLSMREGKAYHNEQGVGLKDTTAWLPAFYQCRDFLMEMQEIYQQELYPLLKQVFLGDGQGRHLCSFAEYNRQIEAARNMNVRLNPHPPEGRFYNLIDVQDALEQLERFLSQRTEWLYARLEKTADQQIGYVNFATEVIWLNVEDTCTLNLGSLGPVEVIDLQIELTQEATEEEYAIYYINAQLAPKDGWTFTDEVELPLYVQGQVEDGVLSISYYVRDSSYRPLWYDDTDYGMIFDWEYFASVHPNLVEEYGNDPIALLERFLDVDIYKGRMGTWRFSPILTAQALPDVASDLGESWELYYDDFMDYGWEEWPIRMNNKVTLTIVPPPEEE